MTIRKKPSDRKLIACLSRHHNNVRAAAEELDVNPMTIHRWMKALDLPANPVGRPPKPELFKATYDIFIAGMSVVEAANFEEVTQATIRHRVISHARSRAIQHSLPIPHNLTAVRMMEMFVDQPEAVLSATFLELTQSLPSHIRQGDLKDYRTLLIARGHVPKKKRKRRKRAQ